MESSPSISPHRRPHRIAKWLVSIGIPWAVLTLSLITISEPTPENLTLFTSILGSGLYTLLLWLSRPLWLPRISGHPVRNAAIVGTFNAAVIEALFLLMQTVFDSEGIAAYPNLWIDLLLTMPWYIMMVITFTRVQNVRRFSTPTVLLLGAVYEFGADGLVSEILASFSGNSQLLSPAFWVMMAGVIFWQFILVYSSMVLPPAWVLDQAPRPAPMPWPAWRDALRPLVWLIPFTIYLFVVLLVASLIAGST
ncbi:MAG: hypothetical protein PVF49_11980 [Anaerolineales bacterium]|jgi:hypothetical protein